MFLLNSLLWEIRLFKKLATELTDEYLSAKDHHASKN